MRTRADHRSPEAKAWRHLYSTRAWKTAKATQRAKQPLCEPCLKRHRSVPMYAVNHKIPHKGDLALFLDPDNHESLCAPCHDAGAQKAEKAGYGGQCDANGWPTDPKHPVNRV